MISFIIPAHNEAAEIGRTLQAIHDAARAVGQPYEIIVVNDASTDATAKIAREHQAIVFPVNHRQIAATRNSGGRAAHGERLFFVDADTTINPRVVTSALRAMDRGAIGGGAPACFDAAAPLYAQILALWFGLFARLAGIAGGAFMFCTRDAFHAVGGFDEKLFGAEDAALSLALRRQGRFVILWNFVITSDRRMSGFKGLKMLGVLLRMAIFPGLLKRRSAVKTVWYDSNREHDARGPSTVTLRVFNTCALLVTCALILPVFAFIPWSWTPRDSLLGELRIGNGIFGCHVALVCWPCAYHLGRNLPRPMRWLERARLVVLLAVCLWFAWEATPIVIWFWTEVFHWLARFF